MQKRVEYKEAILRKYPEAVAIAIAKDAGGTPNPITLGWSMVTSGTPPMLAISVGKTRYSLEAIRQAGEFVLAFPSEHMADEALFYGSHSGRDMLKLKEYGAKTAPASAIDCVILADAVANFGFDVSDAHEVKLCPDCGIILLKYRVGHGLDFFVDHCSGCGGVWLDKNEWKALKDRNLHDEIHKIFSTAWQNQVRGDEMADKLDQAYANRFGAEAYEKAKDIRKWIQGHPQSRALLAFLSDENPYKI